VSFPRALLVVLALLQATGIAEVVRRATCEEECKDDGCDDDCAPGSDAPACVCHCPAAPIATAPAHVVETVAAPAVASVIGFERTERFHASPDPREILHVPRPNVV
jgi:hypothetical protein